MDFAARLERLRQLQRERESRIAAEDAPCEASAGTGAGLTEGVRDHGSGSGPEVDLGLSRIDTEAGPAFVHKTVIGLSHCQGKCCLAGARGVGSAAWALLGGHRDSADSNGARRLDETAFIDVETTGLAGGTGVVAFLIGIARVRGDIVEVSQFFLRDFGEEEAQLHGVDDALAGARTIITYNGKIFDWPLIEARCVMNRMRLRARPDGHIDLVFPARRIWQHHLADRRLTTVEQEILGLARHGDVPGELIPALYFGYQRSGDARPLQPVLEHNRLDILSLIGLLGVIGGALTDPFGGAVSHAAEFHGLGRWCLDLGLAEAGVRCLEHASRADLPPAVRERVLRDLAATYKRLKQHGDALAVWRALVADGALSAFPYVELAKHHEHAERDYARALEMVDRALAVHLGRGRRGDEQSGRELRELLHRRDRLGRKLGTGVQTPGRGRQRSAEDRCQSSQSL